MLINEFTDWLPWFAARLIRVAARTLPSEVRPRYADEWLAEFDAVPGNLSKLVLAIRIFTGAPRTAAALGGVPSLRAVAVKAFFDTMVAGWALIMLAPMFAVIALIIKITDGGPVFSGEIRIGKDSKPFYLYKFRTTVAEGEGLGMLLPAPDGRVLRLVRGDPRLTRVGAWLRRLGLNELPQLLNVLSGDMSLVGPYAPKVAIRFREHMRTSPTAKPGITGLWQVNGQSDLSWHEVEWLNQRYVDNWSLALDVQILWKTWRAVLRYSGYSGY